jgi:hypothetical protein
VHCAEARAPPQQVRRDYVGRCAVMNKHCHPRAIAVPVACASVKLNLRVNLTSIMAAPKSEPTMSVSGLWLRGVAFARTRGWTHCFLLHASTCDRVEEGEWLYATTALPTVGEAAEAAPRIVAKTYEDRRTQTARQRRALHP